MLTCFRILVVDHVEVFGHTVKSCAWKSIKFCCAVAVCFASASGRSQTACRNVGKSVPHHTCTRSVCTTRAALIVSMLLRLQVAINLLEDLAIFRVTSQPSQLKATCHA